MKGCDLLNGPALEYLSWIVFSGILRLEGARVLYELANQVLCFGIDLCGSGFRGGFFHGNGNVGELVPSRLGAMRFSAQPPKNGTWELPCIRVGRS